MAITDREKVLMRARVYIIIDIVEGKSEQVAQILRSKSGVKMVDMLENSHDIMVIVEASEWQKLAELTVEALGSVEAVTEGLQLLPVRK